MGVPAKGQTGARTFVVMNSPTVSGRFLGMGQLSLRSPIASLKSKASIGVAEFRRQHPGETPSSTRESWRASPGATPPVAEPSPRPTAPDPAGRVAGEPLKFFGFRHARGDSPRGVSEMSERPMKFSNFADRH